MGRFDWRLYLVNILILFICVLIVFSFVVGVICGIGFYCSDEGVVVDRMLDYIKISEVCVLRFSFFLMSFKMNVKL